MSDIRIGDVIHGRFHYGTVTDISTWPGGVRVVFDSGFSGESGADTALVTRITHEG